MLRVCRYKTMNEQKIETPRFIIKSAVKLLNSQIVVNTSTPFESSQFEVSCKQIEYKKSVSAKVNFGLLIFTLFLGFTGVMFLWGNSSYISAYFFGFAAVILLVVFPQNLKLFPLKLAREMLLSFSLPIATNHKFLNLPKR